MTKHRKKSPVELEYVEPHLCSIDLRLSILRHLPFFASITGEEIGRINASFREQGFAAGEPIYYAGAPAERLYVVASGIVKVIRHTMTGQDLLLDILVPGEFFGSLSLPGDETYPDTAIAQAETCALAISREDFRAVLARHPAAALAVLDITTGRLQAAQETIRQLSAHSVEERIAFTLLRLAEKLGEPREEGLLIQTPLSREDLASMVGATPESASRVISHFQKSGLIETGRQWIALTDPKGLQEVAAVE